MRNWIITFTSLSLLCVQVSFTGQNNVDWWQIQKDLTNKLLGSETDIAQLAREVSSKEPQNGYEAMFKLSVLMRTGMNKEAIQTLHELKPLYNYRDYDIKYIFGQACELEAWELAKSIVEIFADEIDGIGFENNIVKHFLNSGWTLEQVDQWFAEMSKGVNNFWLKERLAFNVIHDREDNLIKALSNNIRENPHDIENAITFLDALIYASRSNKIWDLSWMSEIIKPKFITQAESIASKLSKLSQPSTAIIFYQYALYMELTDEEAQQLRMSYSAFVPDDIMRAGFKVNVREGMSKCFLSLDMKDQAQKLMVEAADIREEYGLSFNALFSGQVQAISGQRVIEGRILEEDLSEDEPQYWYERAAYYRGRMEVSQEEHALKKGYALTLSQPERKFKGNRNWRITLLDSYAFFLKRQNRSKEAVELLLKEISEAPADSDLAVSSIHSLAYDFEKFPSVNEEVLWTWLENRTKWEHTEERLLWRMMENAIPEERRRSWGVLEKSDSEVLDKYLTRAEKLAFDNDSTRACTIGWIERVMKLQKRSIKLLEYAYKNAKNEELKQITASYLFQSYLDTGDWKNAEEIFSDVAKRLTYQDDLHGWYSRVAVAAAKAGARKDAIRLWSRAANLNPAKIGWLEYLVEYGLKEELKDFYLKMQQKMPSSEVPAKAFSVLEN